MHKLNLNTIQIGTAFVASTESAAIAAYKEALQNAQSKDSVLTKSFSRRWARGLKNGFITEIENSGVHIREYPVQGSLTSPVRLTAQQQNDKDFTSLWSGESPSKPAMLPVAEIFKKLVKETEELFSAT